MHRANHVGGGAASECKHKTEMDTYVEKPFCDTAQLWRPATWTASGKVWL